MNPRFIIFLFFLSLSVNGVAQSFFGFTVDEKFSVHKNRIGASLFWQSKKKSKTGISFNYNYSLYTYPDITYINNIGTGYVPKEPEYPPYYNDIGINTVSKINGIDIEVFNNLRLKTFKRSNLDLKITIGYGQLVDTYSSLYLGKKRTGKFAFNEILCNMYFSYLIWYKSIGVEPLFGAAYYIPLITGPYSYLPPNPFVGTELEAGISFYFQKNKKRQQ